MIRYGNREGIFSEKKKFFPVFTQDYKSCNCVCDSFAGDDEVCSKQTKLEIPASLFLSLRDRFSDFILVVFLVLSFSG